MKTEKQKQVAAVAAALIAVIVTSCGQKVQTVYLRPLYQDLTWQQAEFTVTSGTQVKLVMDNIATGMAHVMSHNAVILVRADSTEAQEKLINEVGKAATTAGEEKDFFPENHPGILLRTPLAAPGQMTEIIFTAPEPGDYPYICTFAGHWTTMRGIMHVIP